MNTYKDINLYINLYKPEIAIMVDGVYNLLTIHSMSFFLFFLNKSAEG